MKLVITIDAEEDNWESFDPSHCTVKNINKIPALQNLFDEFGAKPTYLIDYPVATAETAISIFKSIIRQDRCEIGAHCHPWNTPPFREEANAKNRMLCNLPVDLQYEKLSTLYKTIQRNLGVTPVSFRSGKWGYSASVAKNISLLGNIVDTSILPYENWMLHHGPDYSAISPRPFRFSSQNIFLEDKTGAMAEIPATVGYLQQNFTFSNGLLKIVQKKPFNKMRIIGLLSAMRLLNKVWLSPEQSDSQEMIKLTRSMMRNNYQVINMFFHSSTLLEGMTPYVRTKSDEQRFFKTIRNFLEFAKSEGIECSKLKDCAADI